MIGTWGALDPAMASGDVVVPSRAVAREAIAHRYGTVAEETGIVPSDPRLTALGGGALKNRGIRTADSLHFNLEVPSSLRPKFGGSVGSVGCDWCVDLGFCVVRGCSGTIM